MTKTTEELHAELARLRNELAALDTDDDDARARLQQLVDQIDRRLDEAATAEHHASLTEQIREGIEHFEVEHPRATGILNQIAMTLSGMGI